MARFRNAAVVSLMAAGLILAVRGAFAQGSSEGALSLFYQANQQYQDSAYAQAASLYEQVVAGGYESGPLYYNLGNSYVKLKEYGRAVLSYERAGLFIPADSDLQANYRYLRGVLSLGEQELASGPLLRWNARLWERVSANGIVVLLSLFYVLLLAGIFVRIYSRSFGRSPWVVVVCVVLMMLGISALSALGMRQRFLHRAAVVLSGDAPARFEPQEAATVHFTLAEGSLVELLQENGTWVKLRRSDGKTGWTQKSSIEKIR